MRELASFVMQSLVNAIGVAGLLGALSFRFLPLSLLSAAVVGLIALRKGLWDALIVCAGAAVLVATAWLINFRPCFGFPVVVALWLPMFACAEVLRRTESQGKALMLVALFAALLVVLMHLLTGDVVAWWKAWLKQAVTCVPGATVQGFERNDTLRLMNGLVATAFGISLMASVLLARWLQSLLYHPGGYAAEFHALRLPRLLLPVIVAVLLAVGGLDKGVLVDLFMVSVMMYFFQGLAVLHGVVAARNLSWVWVLPPYLVLPFAPQYVLMGLAVLGAMDSLIDFRARAARG